MTPQEQLIHALIAVDDQINLDQAHDADTIEALGRIASEWALQKLANARVMRRAALTAEHPSLFVEDVGTELV